MQFSPCPLRGRQAKRTRPAIRRTRHRKGRAPAAAILRGARVAPRRGARVVESGGLENRCRGNPSTEGSNPSPSASSYRARGSGFCSYRAAARRGRVIRSRPQEVDARCRAGRRARGLRPCSTELALRWCGLVRPAARLRKQHRGRRVGPASVAGWSARAGGGRDAHSRYGRPGRVSRWSRGRLRDVLAFVGAQPVVAVDRLDPILDELETDVASAARAARDHSAEARVVLVVGTELAAMSAVAVAFAALAA